MGRNSFIFSVSVALLLMLLGTGCSTKWSVASRWYDAGRPVNDSLVDVFYVVSTEILEEKDSHGRDAYIGRLTDEERVYITGEMDYIRKMFGDSVNFFSPYYNQFTLSALSLPAQQKAKVRQKASADALAAFRHYLRHQNQGRRFILAGFSQGAMHLLDMLRQLRPEEYERMVVAYCMGYRLSAQDLQHPNLVAATSARDRGTIVSFNSVATPDAIWPEVNGDAVTCINPVNYRTDDEPATFTYQGDTLTVRVDTLHNVLIVDSPKIETYRFPMLDGYCKPGNLHHWDLLFYGDHIRRNALQRAY